MYTDKIFVFTKVLARFEDEEKNMKLKHYWICSSKRRIDRYTILKITFATAIITTSESRIKIYLSCNSD
jgi:hypothetical protein